MGAGSGGALWEPVGGKRSRFDQHAPAIWAVMNDAEATGPGQTGEAGCIVHGADGGAMC